ncbi:mRNA decay protein [Malassezia sp. CBS 17886]|nr:mRNA decay protein [Malassezia sp. CBS 17886]
MSTASTGSPLGGERKAPVADAAVAAERDRWRRALLAAHASVWRDGPSDTEGALDSTLKRNSGFIKRLRQGNVHDVRESLLREAGVLNLDKYMDELIPSAVELLARSTTVRDRQAAVELMSALFVRFGGRTFGEPLAGAVATQLAPANRAALQELPAEQREKEENARIARQRVLVRSAAELALTGIVRGAGDGDDRSSLDGASGHDWLFRRLRDLLASDREHANIPLLMNVLKTYGTVLLAPRTTAAAHEDGPVSTLVSAETKARFRTLFVTYHSTIVRRLEREHAELVGKERRNRDAYIRSGELFEDRQQSFERQQREWQRLLESAQAMADALDVPMPELRIDSETPGPRLGVNLDAKSTVAEMSARVEQELASGKSPWEDEETRYMENMDAGDMDAGDTDTEDADGGGMGPGDTDADAMQATPDSREDTAEADKKAQARAGAASGAAAHSAAQASTILAQLPELGNRAMVDEAAVQLAFVNARTTRMRLAKHLAGVPRERQDLLPYYARLVATLHPFMGDMSQTLVAALDAEFRRLQRRRGDGTQARRKNARFLGELTKFGVVPDYVIFHALRTCLASFSVAGIEALSVLLETCGRFLLRTPATGAMMHACLEQLQRKRVAHHIDPHLAIVLDNAYFQCVPPPRAAPRARALAPMERYIAHLLTHELCAQPVGRVTALVRRLPWADGAAYAALCAAFAQPWRVTFDSVPRLAAVAVALRASHPAFVTHVLDSVCEAVLCDIAAHDVTTHQRRIALAHYVGALCSHGAVSTDLVLDQMWLYCTALHPDARPDTACAADARDNYFRVRLVCAMLAACAGTLDRGTPAHQVDELLVVFEEYVQSKAQPLPADVAHDVARTLDPMRRKRARRCVRARGAQFERVIAYWQRRTDLACAARTKQVHAGGSVSADDASADDASADGSSSDASEAGAAPTDGGSADEFADEDALDREAAALDRDADDALDRDLAKLMAESHVGAPANAVRSRQFLQEAPSLKRPARGDNDDYMVFSLLSRRGNRSQAQEIRLPSTEAISVRTRQKQDEEAEERRQLKAYVLGSQGAGWGGG